MTNLKRLKLERNLTTKELSELTGLTKQMINYMENGVRKGSITTNIKLAKALNVSLDELVEKEEKWWIRSL